MLHLIQLQIEPRPLYEWSRQTGTGTSDRGYLIHSAMRIAFGDAAPQPFAVFSNCGTPMLKVLGYADHGVEPLKLGLALAEPVLEAVFPAARMAAKSLPEVFPVGMSLAFRTECCPVTRYTGPEGKTREKDAFLAACDARPEDKLVRDDIYTAWLAAELARSGAAHLERASMKGFRLFEPVRRHNGKRPIKVGKRPRANMDGVLRVDSSEDFSSLLARGIGRHRAFGLGMLLLRPA